MRMLKYRKIDAFTSGISTGNPAACIFIDSPLDDREMLDIARQHRGFVSEVVFCRSNRSGIDLTYFSSEGEVSFCGHGTIACMYCLIRETPELSSLGEITVQTRRKGAVTVYNELATQDAIYVAAPEPRFIGTRLSRSEVAAALGSDDADVISGSYQLDIIDAGLRTLIVPVADLEPEVSMVPDQQALKRFCTENGIDIVLTFCTKTQNPEHIVHSRVFAPKFGYLEDPATGSGNSALGFYMLNNNIWHGADCAIEQGGKDREFNAVRLRRRENTVLFGGSATIRIDGVYFIADVCPRHNLS